MTRKSPSTKRNGGKVGKRATKKGSSSGSSSTLDTKTNKNQRMRKKRTGCVNNGKQQSGKVKKPKPVTKSNVKAKNRESKGKCKTVAVVNPRKRKLIDEEIEIIDTRSCKRMASLNASAILASLSERRIVNQSRSPIETTRATESTRCTRSTVVKILETEISSSESVPVLGSSHYPERRLTSKQSRLIESTRSSGSTRSTDSTVYKILETEISSSESRVRVSSPETDIGSPQYPERRVSTKQSRSIESTRSTASTRSTGATVVKILETKISSSDSQVQLTSPVASQYTEKRDSKQSRSIESSKRSGGSTTKSTGSTVVKIYKTKISSSDSQHISPVTDIGSHYPEKRVTKQSRSIESKRSTGLGKSTGSTVVKIRETKISSSDTQHVTPSVHNIGALQYPNEMWSMSKPCRSMESSSLTGATTMAKIFETEINAANSILQVPPIPTIGRPQYPPLYASAFSVPHHINHAASINYPTESYGFYPHSVGCGPIMQPIHDRTYSLHKPIPYYASQMAHHPDQVYREFNPIPSYYILQYPNNDLSCSLRANNMYHNMPTTNDRIATHQQPHDSQHLSVNIAVNNPTATLMTRDSMATIATTAQTISSNHMNPTHLQTIPTPSTSSFSSTATSTGAPSIAFLGSTSILPGRLAPSMFQAISSSSPLSAASSSSVIVNSIINPELPQGLSPVPGPAPVAVATPVSVENLTTLSTASPSNLPSEIASLSSTTFSISNQVGFSPIITNNNQTRSPSTFGSPLTLNHQQSNVATISPLVTSGRNRYTGESVSCSTNTDPEPRRTHNSYHPSNQFQQNINQQQSTSFSQAAITITPFNVNSSNNYTHTNNLSNTFPSVTNSNSSLTNNLYTRDSNYSINNLNGGNSNNRHHQSVTTSSHNTLKDASVNTTKNGKDSPTVNNMTRKNQRKQFENSTTNNIPVIGKQRTLTNRSKYPQSHSTSSSFAASSPAPMQTPMTSTATNTPSSSSISPSNVNLSTSLSTGTTNSSASSSSGHQQLVSTSTNTNYVNSNNNKKVIPISNNHANGQLTSMKKRPTKSSKTLIDANSVHGESSSSTSSSSSTTIIAPTIDQAIGSRKTGKKRLFHGWSWRGNPTKKPVFIKPDEPPQLRDCYNAICHIQGDVIKVRDSVLLRGGPRKTDLHFVAKICALWEAPETGEMMMSLLWYYRPEHTEPGRKPHDQLDEIFASKHQDVNSVACIDDKCHVLTFNEYCRYRKRQKMDAENISISLTNTYVPTGKDYNRRSRLPMRKVFPDRVFFCRKVYDFRLGRTLKNPVPPVINNDNAPWKR